MKTRLTILKLLVVLCSVFATTAVFGQTTYTWTGAGDGTNFFNSYNWSPYGYPNPYGYRGPNSQDTAQWDGVTTTNLVVSYTVIGVIGFPIGINFVLTANQTNSVQIISPQSAGLDLFEITNDSPSAGFVLGDGSANVLGIVMRPNGATHDWVNNSAAPATINPNVSWRAGGVAYTLAFDGTGDWRVTNGLRNANNTPTAISKQGTGTLYWNGPSIPTALGNSPIASLAIGTGTVVLQWNNTNLNHVAIQNDALLEYDAAGQSQTLGGIISGTGKLILYAGTLTLTASNTYTGGTTINAGTLQVGAVGTSGAVGSGSVINFGVLVFNRSDAVTFGGAISGAGSLVKQGSGTLTLSGANTYTGTTTVSNGTLVVTNVGGNMNVSGGTLVPGGIGSVGTLNVAGNMNISAGTVSATLNKTLSPSNSVYSVTGTINRTGGNLTVHNFGPNLVVGDKFTIFSQPVTGGAAMTIVSPGFTVANNLAVDGSVTVASVAAPATVTTTVSAGQLTLSWPAAWTGLHLQSQTNALTKGLSTNWVTIPGTDAGNSYVIPLDKMKGSVFYRLAP